MNYQTVVIVHILSLIVLGLGVSGCKDNRESAEVQELRSLEEEVMSIHDEVMPKLSDLNTLIKQLEMEPSDSLDRKIALKIAYSSEALREADSLMWAWMHAYQPPNMSGDPDSIRVYLLSEKEKVSVVRDKMLSSISNAQYLIQKITDNE